MYNRQYRFLNTWTMLFKIILAALCKTDWDKGRLQKKKPTRKLLLCCWNKAVRA